MDVRQLPPYFSATKMSWIFENVEGVKGQAEVVHAALDCIVYQIADIVKLMDDASEADIKELLMRQGL